MEDRPQDRTEERRRRGPLGDEGEAEETRHVPRAGDATRGEEGGATHEADTTRGGTSAEEETGTRVIRTQAHPRTDRGLWKRKRRKLLTRPGILRRPSSGNPV
jgi:hypothetical protein